MFRLIGIPVAVSLAACSQPSEPVASAPECVGPFMGLDASDATPEDKAILREASEDFCAVLLGHDPIHAKHSPGVEAPADGGSMHFVGRNYTLTSQRSASSFGSYHGTVTGPILVFDASFAPGNTNVVSQLHVQPVLRSPESAGR